MTTDDKDAAVTPELVGQWIAHNEKIGDPFYLQVGALDTARAYLKLHEENTRLRECLRFYADGYGRAFGHVAREALKEQPE